MNTLRSLSRAGFAAFVFVAAVGMSFAAEISGKYDDKGVQIIADSSKTSPEVSLHALLSLRFEPGAHVDFRDSDAVEIVQNADVFSARIFDRDNKAAWTGEWKKGQEYTPEGNRGAIRLRGSGSEDIYSLVFEPVSERLLQVEVFKIKTTHLGPIPESIGIYVFSRE